MLRNPQTDSMDGLSRFVTQVPRRGLLGSLHPVSCINWLWRGAVATVLQLGYRGRSLHLVAPHTDARELTSNKNQRRLIYALLTLVCP